MNSFNIVKYIIIKLYINWTSIKFQTHNTNKKSSSETQIRRLFGKTFPQKSDCP